MISQIFPRESQNIYITSVSSHSMHFKLKICETVTYRHKHNQSISQFLEGFCHLDRLCAKGMRAIARCLLLSIYCTLVDKVQNIMLFYVKTCLIKWFFQKWWYEELKIGLLSCRFWKKLASKNRKNKDQINWKSLRPVCTLCACSRFQATVELRHW